MVAFAHEILRILPRISFSLIAVIHS